MTGGLWSGPGPDHRPNRALPEWAIDKLVFGLREDLGGSDPRKVWGECVRIARSAYRRGWTRTKGAFSADEVVQASFDQNVAEITRKTDPEKGALLVWILCGVDLRFRTVMSLLWCDGGRVSEPSKVALSSGSWIISLLNKK